MTKTLLPRSGFSLAAIAITAIFLLAALLTPPDIVSQLSLAIPMVGLYEISIFSARWAEKKRDEGQDDDGDDTAHDETDFNA